MYALSRILHAIFDIYGTKFWPEFSTLIWTLIVQYRREVGPILRLEPPNAGAGERTPGA